VGGVGGNFQGLDICEIIQFHFIFCSKKVEKISSERLNKGKKRLFSFGFFQKNFEFLKKIKVFFCQ
jgi:hypothetical protein